MPNTKNGISKIKKIPIEVSARHIHLSQKDLEKLFSKGYKLKKMKALIQVGDFAAKETLDIQNGSKKISGVRIVGPTRKETQVELSRTDAIHLRLNPPIRISGNIKGTPGIMLIGPKKKVKIRQGLIIAQRHIHCAISEAKKFGLKNGMRVSVKVKGPRAMTFHNVKIRVDKNYRLCMHIDTDEGNAVGIIKKGKGVIEKLKL